MIRIEENKEDLLKDHCDYLCQKIETRIDNVLKDNGITKNKKKISLNVDIKNCLEYIKVNLKNIISYKTKDLINIIKYFEFNYPCLTNKYEDKEPKPPIYAIIYNIFVDNGYNSYLTDVYKDSEKKVEKEYHSYKFVEKLGIKCCPYCNRSYISFVKNEKKQTRPELDHYYPKSIYPFLACSFYNLIPSCSPCNHMKSSDDSYIDEKKGKLISPYNVEDKDFRFSYSILDLKLIEVSKKEDIDFEYEDTIEIKLESEYEKNKEYFQLEEVYQNHKDIVIELILKEINYPKSYIDELIRNNFGTEEEIYRFIFANYLDINDLHKRPLSKLTRDIVTELGLLKKIELAFMDRSFSNPSIS